MLKVFHGQTEDGTHYRVYHEKQLEVRTIQEHDQAETIAVVFEFALPELPHDEGKLPAQELLTHVTLCIGWAGDGPGGRLLELEHQHGEAEAMPFYRFFLLVQTKGGHTIITEMLSDGTVTLEEDPADLEHRRERAKVLNHYPCKGWIVSELRAYRREWHGKYKPVASPSTCKRYAKGTFQRLSGLSES